MKRTDKKSALSEVDGISEIKTVSHSSVERVNRFRRKQPSAQELIDSIISGNKTALSRAITLVESTNPEHSEKASQVINGCLPYANNSIRIGITGVPGVGKSTFIEARSEEHTSELQSREKLVCRLLLEKKKRTAVAQQ